MRLLESSNPFKLVIFGANVSGGCNVSTAPERIKVEWSESVRIVKAAEEAGFDGLIPISRWVGFGGLSNHNDRCFETCAWAAAVAAVTTEISVFTTVHVQSVHPVRIAKEAATIDHISNGRFGINVVAGYVPAEVEMFGHEMLPHDARYAYAEEWMEIVRRIWSEDTFDFRGKHFNLKGLHGEPKPIQKPYPMIMNAGNSKQGSAFAAKYADILYVNIVSINKARELVEGARRTARELAGKSVLVMAPVTILCRDTEKDCEDYYEYLVHRHGDWEGARNIARALLDNASSIINDEKIIERIVLTFGGYPIIGTPDQVVEGLKQLADTGLDGIALSWPNFEEGIARYRTDLLPRLRAAGLRS